jgi:hypothetical protein
MSRHRELKNAQAAVNEGVEVFLNSLNGPGGSERGMRELNRLGQLWFTFDQLRRDFDGDAPVSARDTSIAAAKTNLPLKGSMRRTIVQTIVAHHCEYRVGMTCAELEARLRKTHQTVSSAVNYAETAGWIRDSGQRKLTPSKAKAIVWEPTEAATTAIKEAGLL